VTVGKGDASPVLAGEKHYVFGRQEADEVVLCLNPASGKSIWEAKYPAGRVVGGPAVRHPVLIGACQTRSSVHSLGTAVQQNEAADQSAGWH
jgi:outer membrane protein assembly factor BamB